MTTDLSLGVTLTVPHTVAIPPQISMLPLALAVLRMSVAAPLAMVFWRLPQVLREGYWSISKSAPLVARS